MRKTFTNHIYWYCFNITLKNIKRNTEKCWNIIVLNKKNQPGTVKKIFYAIFTQNKLIQQ